MSAGCDGPFRVRVLVPAEPAIVRVPVPAAPAVIRVPVPGPMGPEGPPGKDGGTHTTVIAQDQPATVWTLAHGLGRYPSVTLVDTAGDLFFACLTYLDADTIRVTLDAPCAGKAFLN